VTHTASQRPTQRGTPTLPNRLLRSSAILLLTGLASLILPVALSAQTASSGANSDAVKMFHPPPPLPSYEVATIKKADPSAQAPIMARHFGSSAPRGGAERPSSDTIRNYILNAYGASTRSQAQLSGGPAWINTDEYAIQGKVPDEMREAMQKMPPGEQQEQTRMMQQSLLADRFHLKMHFEIRQLSVFELTPAKNGMKFKQVPSATPSDPASHPAAGAGRPPMPAGMIFSVPKPDGGRSVSMHAISMSAFIDFLRRSPEISGRPILDKTDFTGTFDVTDMDWSAGSPDAPEAPSLSTTLNGDLGLKLNATKGPVEVLVIDSIDRPSEN
jgi:uncharacterized protein (TIGR03435 family)